ncbi:Cd(II)/Pb(II)-responsive transcriptional regulator [Geomonas silvestris]|uniref:Cd(II)/Pb(II)-responsive transcriptional regulator n=1 Tax=Geomonas silvestris TaxID=2740184 RepID=A0A6V8MJ70_9BACT|nr:MerR family transcriptional regulator [Geomonas silvestris]GFO60006.1 Cd(II)/Pb(II)-responsive transcriptional regulator [Geomonas silvestris]
MRLNAQDCLQISDLAKKLGITARTIRLYEQMGLVDPPRRTDGGIRVYDQDDVLRFKFILKVKELGLSLAEMQELAQIYKEHREPDKIMPRLVELLEFHLAGIRHKVAQLQSLEKDIVAYRQRILDAYPNGFPPGNQPDVGSVK